MALEAALWIQSDPQWQAPLFRKEFTAPAAAGTIDICGLGYFVLYINGKRVSDDQLTPVYSDYHRRADREMIYPIHDTFTYRTYYRTYDLADYLHPGVNTLGVILGNGWYGQRERSVEGAFWYGDPKLAFQLTLSDGSMVVSDTTVRTSPSHILRNNIYHGEWQDARLLQPGWSENGFNDSGWEPARPAGPHDSILCPQECPPDRIIQERKPRLLHEIDGKRIYDAGINTTGWVVMRTWGEAGSQVSLRFGEELDADGRLDIRSAGYSDQVQRDVFISDGTSRVFTPMFTFHGFRYFEVEGQGEPLACQVVHSDVPVTSSFSCDNEVLNWLYHAYLNSQRTNYHGGVPSDCPHRERLGYTGDGQLTCDAAMLMLDAAPFYRKWIRDIADCQDVVGGHIQHTAPFQGGGGGPGGWGCAIAVVPWQYFLHYDDPQLLEEYYPHILHWLDYMETRTENGLITWEEKGGWCLGDWCTPGLKRPDLPDPFVNTYFYIKSLDIAQAAARILGREADLPRLQGRRQRAVQAMEAAYLDPQTGSFCQGTEGADAFAVDIGLGDARTLENLAARYAARPVYDTGIFGTDIVTWTLCEHGHAQTAFDMLTSRDAVSFYTQMAHGATTLWERWDARASHNHPMFGAVTRCLFYQFLGIRQEADSRGFAKVVIAPKLVEGMDWAKGSIVTAHGRIAVGYAKEGSKVRFTVELDGDVQARFQWKGVSHPLAAGKQELLLPLV